MSLPWDDPNADPIGDIKRVIGQMEQEYRNTWHHRFDNEGRCKYCEVAMHNASKYPCIDEKETNEQDGEQGPVVAPV